MHNYENINYTNPFFNNIYIGVVEDNNDPNKTGRVKVRILGLHTSIKMKSSTEGLLISDLPWAIPANPIQGGSISGLGWSGVPVLGSHVAIFFIGGDHNFPVYFATIAGIYTSKPDTTKGFSDPTGKYPTDINKPDFNEKASVTNTVFETPDNGVIVEYDSTSGAEKWKVTLKAANSTIELNRVGDVNVTSTKSGGNINIKATSTGIINLQVGDISLEAIDGVITGKSICHFTGSPHADVSTKVRCSKE